jgi:hypothetical protein
VLLCRPHPGFANFADELKKHEVTPAFNELAKKLKATMKNAATPFGSAPGDDEEEDEEAEEEAQASEQ